MIQVDASHRLPTSPVVLTRRDGLIHYSSDDYQEAISESENINSLDDWEQNLHFSAEGIRKVIIPIIDKKEPEIINQTACKLSNMDQQRLRSSYFALWQTSDPDRKDPPSEPEQDAVSCVVCFLIMRFQGLSKQIVMDYSTHSITLS